MNEMTDVFELDVRIDAVPADSDRRSAADGPSAMSCHYSCMCPSAGYEAGACAG